MTGAGITGVDSFWGRLSWDDDGRPVALRLGAAEVSIARLPRSRPESKSQRQDDKAVIMRRLLPELSSPDHRYAELVSDEFGRPYIVTSGGAVHGVSFSRDLKHIWGATSAGGRLGIDASSFEEFADPYPFRRAFCDSELNHLNRVHGAAKHALASLLWSVKEAAVKRLGHGFHLVDPRNVRTSVSPGNGSDFFSEVTLDKTSALLGRSDSIPVYSFSSGSGWLSIAPGET